jgi:hypothetical protein
VSSFSDADLSPAWAQVDSYRVIASPIHPSPAWLAGSREQIRELLALEPGWDLYSARRISNQAAMTALQLVDEAARLGCPAPSIVPLSPGGIQLEWHLRRLNIEASIPPEGQPIEFWYEDLIDRSEHQFVLVDDLSPLRRVLTMLARR